MPPRNRIDRSYAGYGLPDAPAPGSSSPQTAIEECLRAGGQILGDAIFRSEEVAWHEPPFNAQFFTRSVRFVLNIDAAVDAAANAAGLALIAAESAFVAPSSATTSGAALQYKPIFGFIPNQNQFLVIKSWGIEAVNVPPEAVNVRLRGGTVGGLGSPPDPAVSGFQVKDHQPTQLVVLQGKRLIVEIGQVNNDQPIYVKFSACFWVGKTTDASGTRESLLVKGGYGKGCK